MGLYVKKLHADAKIPTVTHAGEDLGFDLYALESIALTYKQVTRVRTGIAARFLDDNARGSLGGNSYTENICGLIIKDRSSMATKGITVSAGVVDAGYTNEILVLLTNNEPETYFIDAHTKIAQMIPIKVETSGSISVVDDLPKSMRGLKGFGSSGQ